MMGPPNPSWLITLFNTLKKFQREHSETPQIPGSFSSQSPKQTFTVAQLGTSRGGGHPGKA